MKPARTESLLGHCLAMCGLVLVACGDPFSASPPPSPDEGVGAGGGGGALSSASVDPISVSSASTSATSGAGGDAYDTAHTIVVVDLADVPVANVDVTAHDAAGAPIGVKKTGRDGTVQLDIPLGGSVLAFTPLAAGASSPSYVVAGAVDPPEGALVRLTAYVPGVAPPPPPAPTTYKLIAQGYPQQAASLTYITRCTTNVVAASYLVVDNGSCTQLPTQDFLIIAKAGDGTPLAWGSLVGAATSPGAVLDYSVSVNQTTFAAVDIQVVNVTTTATDGGTWMAPSVPFTAGISDSISASSLYPSFTTTTLVPAGWPVSYLLNADVGTTGAAAASRRYISRSIDAIPSALVFDVASMPALSFDSVDASDPARPVFHWSYGPGLSADAGSLQAIWADGVAYRQWLVALPPDYGASFHLPTLPPELSSYGPTAAGSFSGTVSYQDYDSETGYGEVLDGILSTDGVSTLGQLIVTSP